MIARFRPCLVLFLCLSWLLVAPAGAKQVNIVKEDNYRLDASTLRGIRFRMADPDLELKLGGRLHLDANFFDEDRTDLDDDFDVRRGRVYLGGRFLEDFNFKVEREFSNGAASANRGWRNLWARYQPTRHVRIRTGNFVAPFGLEDVSSSNHSTFLERGLPSVIAPSFQTGAGLQTRGGFEHGLGESAWTWAAAGYVEPLNDLDLDRHKSEHWGVSSRATFAPLASKRRLIHLGGSFEYRDVDAQSLFRYRTRAESSLGAALLNTGRLSDVDHVVSFGAEAAALLGPFSVQGEYMKANLTRSGRPDPGFDGWYAQASYLLTGEARRYSRSTGVFWGVKPKRAWGAVEMALRYSRVDLNDETVTGGVARDLTLGLNWYIQENLRLMFNYVRVNGLNFDLEEDNPQIYQLRMALFF